MDQINPNNIVRAKHSSKNYRLSNFGLYVNEKDYFDQAFIENKHLFRKIREIETRSKPKNNDSSNLPINSSRIKNLSSM